MYNKKNQGHGICGAKNIYSCKVHVDNWIEDTVGMDLSKNPRTGDTLYRTLTAETFCPPSDRPDLPPLPANMPSTLELKTKNKEGMPYSLLFDHSMKSSESDVSGVFFSFFTFFLLNVGPVQVYDYACCSKPI
jgi:hypothetical protein